MQWDLCMQQAQRTDCSCQPAVPPPGEFDGTFTGVRDLVLTGVHVVLCVLYV